MKLLSIQALRGIAVLLVFAYHASARESAAIAANGSGELPLLGGLWSSGYAGVDLFFVISGFIMVFVTGNAKATPAAAGAFMFARIVRIYPLWWLFSTVLLIYLLTAFGAPYNPESLGHTADIENAPWTRLFASYALLPQTPMPILSIGWTLIHEMYFYAVFALILLVRRDWMPMLLAGWAGLVMAGALLGLSNPHARNLVELVFHPMTLEFILGAGGALLAVNGVRWRPGLVASVGAAALVGALLFNGAPTPEMMLFGRVIWFALPCAALVYGLASLDIGGRLQVPSVLKDLGDWSYAFYLSHILALLALERAMPVLAEAAEGTGALSPYLVGLFTLGAPGPADNLFFLVAGLTLSTLVAWASFSLFERPLLRLFGHVRARLFSTTNSQLGPSPIRAAIW